jgi:hypothetical protein
MLLILLGAAFVVAGIVYLASQAIWRGRLSGQSAPLAAPANTLEPPRRGVRFLGLSQNWFGIVLVVVGGVLLLFGGFA